MQVINKSATKSYTIGGYTIAPGVQRFVPDDYYVDMKSIADLAVVGSPPSSSGRQTVVPLYGAVDPSGRVSQVTTSSGTPVVGVGGSSGLDTPFKVGTWSDSLGDICTSTTHNLNSADIALFNGANGRMPRERLGAALLFHSRGRIVPVANAGVGGTTAPQILGRDANAPSATRKGAQDVANMGAQAVVLSLGVNDVVGQLNLDALTPTVRAELFQTIYTSTAAAVRRAQQLGLYPILRELPGFALGFGGHSAASAAAGAAILKEAAEYIANVLVPTLGEMFLVRYRDVCVDPVTGAWYPQYSNDKLHDNVNGVEVIAKRIIEHLDSKGWLPPANPTAYAPLPAGSGSVNGFAAPAMLSVTNGKAAGFDAFSTGSATTIAPSVTTDPDGTQWQDFLLTPVTFDGSARNLAPAGLSVTYLSVEFSVGGATPVLPLAVGDVFRIECDIYIEAAGGGAPTSLLAWSASAQMNYGASSTFIHSAMYAPATNTDLAVPLGVTSGKVVTLPMVSPAASADITKQALNLTMSAGSTAPFRVRLRNPRLVKYKVPA